MSKKPTMHHRTAEAIQTIDAAMFSGDTFENDEARAELREYVDRWDTGIARIEGKPSASETIADQRRTIAKLRARLRMRPGRVPCAVSERDKRWIHERFDVLSDFNRIFHYLEVGRQNWFWPRNQTKKRIAAIRNFGSLPGEPLMPMRFYNGKWHAKADGNCKAAIAYDHDHNVWHWWCVGFAGHVVEKSYQAARDNAEVVLRKRGELT